MKLVEFQKVAEMLAKEHKIKIHEGNGWAANIKDRDVFYVKNDIYNLPEEHILGLLLHEIAHIHYTTDVKLPDKNKELSHSCLNMLEDISIENIIAGDYPNAGEILESTKEEVLDTLVKMLPTLQKSLHEKSMLYAACRFEDRGYAIGVDDYEKLGNKVADIMQKNRNEILNRKETKDLMPIVKEITDLLIKEAGEPTEDEKQSMMEDGNTGRQGGQGEANEGSQTDSVKRDIIDALKKKKGWDMSLQTASQIKYVDEIAEQSQKIGKQLRTVLKRNNAMEYAGRFRTGKLPAKRLTRIAILKDRRPFTHRIVKSNQSYAFAIAADVSGSMFGGYKVDPGSYAFSSMHMVGEALHYANIPRAMIAFGTSASVLSPMGKANIRWEQLIETDKIDRAGGGTRIESGIEACTQELSKIKAERKIMIVLTDGSSDLDYMKEAHKKAEKAGIECLGITIGNDDYSMNETFSKEKNTVIENTRDTNLIGKAFIDILKASVKRSV